MASRQIPAHLEDAQDQVPEYLRRSIGVSPFQQRSRKDEILRLSGMGRGLTEIAALLKCTYAEITDVLDAP
ncbi:hypothetical protein NGM99_11330 [Mesorhizobium sp. RP14(2022)]|jgi:hypothetical protein|uniref:Uncharacterized protein n=1 Tax=Mesorhizobium liriopis TaxID=2953882 RepID=A0ABT1C8T5_9HYPH|nr:hypothetical protein [Mesorhizobium liriopis]MCO6050376.1 hypothetical protein [Mesorhizobium liriopis]